MKQVCWLIGSAVGVAALSVATLSRPSIRLVYNPSDSAPRGWYRVQQTTNLRIGDYVVAKLPSDTAAFAAERGYLPLHVPVLKQLVATAEHHVCVRSGTVLIDGAAVAVTKVVDGKRRALNAWPQCRKLVEGELFLLNTQTESSFDSRYFGPLDVSFVRGKAVPLWTEY